MRMLVRCMLGAVAMASVSALMAVSTVPQVPAKQAAVPQIQLAAADGPGALLGAFLRNQLENCSQICPFSAQGLFTVPIAGAQAPFVFVDAVATQPLLHAVGTAAASVTQPANDAAEGIINNDLDKVLPRAQRALEVAVVEAINVAQTAVTRPNQTVQALNTARDRFLTALNQPLGTPTLPTGATTPLQGAAVKTIEIASAIAFQAGELALLGIV
jgi:hypothetical protein